jgi:hypothetical protein
MDGSPFFRQISRRQIHDLQDGLIASKRDARPDRVTHAQVERFYGVGCVDNLAYLRWKLEKQDDALPIPPPQGADRWVSLIPLLGKISQLAHDGPARSWYRSCRSDRLSCQLHKTVRRKFADEAFRDATSVRSGAAGGRFRYGILHLILGEYASNDADWARAPTLLNAESRGIHGRVCFHGSR